jgi:hypothetical protein
MKRIVVCQIRIVSKIEVILIIVRVASQCMST